MTKIVAACGFLIWLSAVSAIIYVAAHFAMKFW
jgi:hypothetical protein